MNRVTIVGKVVNNAEIILINSPSGKQMPLVKFQVCDMGLPYQKSEPMTIEVQFMKEAASHIYEYLTKDKEVCIDGFLHEKKLSVRQVSKYYVIADYVTLLPLTKKN